MTNIIRFEDKLVIGWGFNTSITLNSEEELRLKVFLQAEEDKEQGLYRDSMFPTLVGKQFIKEDCIEYRIFDMLTFKNAIYSTNLKGNFISPVPAGSVSMDGFVGGMRTKLNPLPWFLAKDRQIWEVHFDFWKKPTICIVVKRFGKPEFASVFDSTETHAVTSSAIKHAKLIWEGN